MTRLQQLLAYTVGMAYLVHAYKARLPDNKESKAARALIRVSSGTALSRDYLYLRGVDRPR